MPKRSPQTIINTRPVVHNGELVSASTVVQVTQLALNGPYRGDFQIIGQGRLIVGEHTDLGERVVATTYGLFGYDPNGANTFAVLSRQYGARGAGDVFAGYIDGNYLLFDQSEGTLGVYSPAGAGFIAASDGTLIAGDSDGAHMRWNSASRALEVRNGEDVKISLDANGDGFFDGTVYASGGRIYGEMQVDSRLRAGDVDGPNVTLGKFERIDETSGALVESGEIIATDDKNMPWFHVTAGGSTANGGWFHLGGTGDYPQRLTYDGADLVFDGTLYARGGEIGGWTIGETYLISPDNAIRLSGASGVQIVSDDNGTNVNETNAISWYDSADYATRTGWIYGALGVAEHNITVESDGRVVGYIGTAYMIGRGGVGKSGVSRLYAFGNNSDTYGANIGVSATGAAGGGVATVNADIVNITANGYWRPASDSTTALQLQNAAGDGILVIDTTNKTVGIGNASPDSKPPDSKLHVLLEDSATNAASQLLTLSHNTSGTVDNGFGSRVLFELETSTTADQAAAALDVIWYEKTHASRKADFVWYAFDTDAREVVRGRGNGSAAAVGFLGATPAARRSHVADPSGGSTVDAEARTAINAILVTLETFGFHATS